MGRFRTVTSSLLVAALLGSPMPARAQEDRQPSVPRNAERNTSDEDSNRLPVSLDRIRRELVETTRTTESRDGLRLNYYVQVYGQSPRIELFLPEENLTTAPAPYGGMTHQEFLRVVTPEEFRSPPADIGAAIAALIKWAQGRKKNEK